jgi:thiol-disulfide isomerase/thioredoxin
VSETARALPGTGRTRWIVGLVLLAVALPLVWLAVTRPLGGLGGAQSAGGAARGVGPLADHEAPNFTLKDPSGKTVELKGLRGKPVLVNFWATWCVPCREELPELERVYRQYHDSAGLVVLAVSIDVEAAAKDVPEYLKAGDPQVGSYTFPVALDTKMDVARLYHLGGVPSSYFIDSAGVIRAVQPGAMNRQVLLDRLRTIVPGAAP